MSSEDDIRDLQDRVERIEQFLQSAFPFAGGETETINQTSETEDIFELISFDVKKSESSIGPEYSYRIGVKNKTGSPLCMGGSIVFLDKDDFEVCTDLVSMFTIPPNSEFTKTGKATIIEESHIPRISNVTAELRPM